MTTPANKSSVLLVDPFNGDQGHPVNDDRFLAECIAPLTDSFLVATSPVTLASIRENVQVPGFEIEAYDDRARFTRARLLKISLTLPSRSFRHVIFQSFEELSTLVFMLLHPRTRVHVIVTSNLRPDRLKRRPLIGGFLLRCVLRRAASVIVHCRHEIATIAELVPDIDINKVLIKPFHQIGWQRDIKPWNQKERTILFLGPECNHKRLDPVMDLIHRDRDCKYRYILCAMGALQQRHHQLAQSHKNVEIFNGHLNDDQYYRLFSDASFVILTHDHNYEGALSGAFCDAIASGTAVIARNMAPHNEFFDAFGAMGYLTNYDDPTWPDRILNCDLPTHYPEFQRNMARLRASCSMDANRAVFATALSAA
jgi:glycosyltransferase involved in cell wall biosynthesis